LLRDIHIQFSLSVKVIYLYYDCLLLKLAADENMDIFINENTQEVSTMFDLTSAQHPVFE
jgi:hypothetical protein